MKNISSHRTGDRSIDRRSLFTMTGAAAVAAILPVSSAEGQSASLSPWQTGNGEWTYKVAEGWGRLPEGKSFGGTHGAIATDRAGLLYVLSLIHI